MRHGEKMANRITEEARDRMAAGRAVYSVVMELEEPRSGPAHDLADVVEDVEELGWYLDRMDTASLGTSARPKVLLLFRRRDMAKAPAR